MRYAKKMTPKQQLESRDQRLSIAEQLTTSSNDKMIIGPSEEAEDAMTNWTATVSGTQQEARSNESRNDGEEHECNRPELKKRRERNKLH
jgi:hypothetical protein